MKSSKRVWLSIVVLLQVCFILSIALSNYSVEWFGKELRLKTVPVDPRNLFYGDYVVLNYEINNIPKTLWEGNDDPDEGDKLIVGLEEQEGYFTVVSIGYNKPKDEDSDYIYVDAEVTKNRGNSIFVKYGIEKYYIPEGSGREIEQQRGEFDVLVKYASWGSMKISRLEFSES
ncbi:GDYXXLXY domain-containing protein [Chengkuizengella axinellae]|uniref:GDYXXLXY domain-containing protein n=1 Tax=Chengkuizengella axinellae TaxID=3064388 RepID=A0ABT9IU00_9BACL|nr:GDYXXLXY domain-containing protein [Chengkuizengella sp. 2205SS18-9]MDP5272831.1 GDYXXLXY domain-containing protein [Chengkuizengella sp. 2205SS18-9]